MGSEQYKENLAKEFATRPASLVMLESLVVLISVLASVTGNMLVLLTMYRNTRLRRPANLYIVSLAITDLVTGSLVGPLCLSALTTGEWKFGRVCCWVFYIFAFTSAEASILTMLLIAVNRYYKIVKPANKYASIFSLRFIIASILLAWILALALPLTVIPFGGSAIGFHPAYVTCVPLANPRDMAVIVTVCIFWAMLPFCFISLLYCKIWFFIKRHNAHMNQSQVNLEDLKLTKSLFAVVGSFAVCYIPYIVISTVDVIFQPRLPRQLYFFSSLMVMIASCINPLIYGAMNRTFRKEVLKIVPSCFVKKSRVGPTSP